MNFNQNQRFCRRHTEVYAIYLLGFFQETPYTYTPCFSNKIIPQYSLAIHSAQTVYPQVSLRLLHHWSKSFESSSLKAFSSHYIQNLGSKGWTLDPRISGAFYWIMMECLFPIIVYLQIGFNKYLDYFYILHNNHLICIKNDGKVGIFILSFECSRQVNSMRRPRNL